jgi:hypothetical protein
VGFNAAEVVAPLEWDFTKFDAGQGTVPEPSDKAIDTLFKDLAAVSRRIIEKAGLADIGSPDPEKVMQALADMPAEGFGITEMVNGFTKAFAKLCQNQPSAIQLNKLPLRIRMRFYMWLASELRPEAGGVGSINQLNGMSRIGLGA